MKSTDLIAIPELQALPVLVGPSGDMTLEDLPMWSTLEQRTTHRRNQIETIAHSGLSLEELHLFFARAGLEAARSWNGDQGFWGKIKNMMTTSHAGFAQVPGRILIQALKRLGEYSEGAVTPAATYLMRADVALDFRDQFDALRAEAE